MILRQVYNIVLYLILPFLPLRLLWRSRGNSSYRKRVLERFAHFDFKPLKESIWVHAVSVGEAVSAVPLIKSLITKYPNIPIVVTTMTPTGAQRVQKIFGNEVQHLYIPYDYPFAIKRFLRQINPKVLILMETELWPNILHYARKMDLPVVLTNARLSKKSFYGYKKIGSFIKKILSNITLVMAQSKLDGARFMALGLEPKKLSIAGNIKFDIEIAEDILVDAIKLRESLGKERPIWVAASTHAGEEEKVLRAAKTVLEKIPSALLILVPRHPERFDQVFELCRKEGFGVARYTNFENYSVSTNIVLGDVMGQLLLLYAASDVCFVGGSLIPWGGHNLLEPAALAKPVVSGPNVSAFLEISKVLADADALIKVVDETSLAKRVLELFQNQDMREKLGAAALDVVEKHRGATKKILAAVENIIG